jgi:hypothetical protein
MARPLRHFRKQTTPRRHHNPRALRSPPSPLAHRLLLSAHRRRAHVMRCSTGCSPATTAANTCCGSRIPTAPARPSRRSTRSSTGSTGLASKAMTRRRVPVRPVRRHAEVAHELLANGHAYRCYLTPGRTGRRRAKPRRPNAALPHRQRMARCRSRFARPPGAPFVVRLKAPREGETVIDDLVQGSVTVSNAEIDDFVLLRGRYADLHARGGGRRSRHGRHPCDPRRRSPQQRLPPADDHPR